MGYWWYRAPSGQAEQIHYCEHAHKIPETAQRCGEREARKRNRTLLRVRGY